MKNPAGFYIIEIRDRRLRGGKLSISSATRSRPVYRKRYAAVRQLIDAGELDIVERLRSRKDALHIADVERAVADGDIDRLRLAYRPPLTLGDAGERLLARVKATKAPATFRQYEIVLRLVREHFGDDRKLEDIGSDDWSDWLAAPKATNHDQPWAPARQKLAWAFIARLYNVEIRREGEKAGQKGHTPRIRVNPLRNVDLAPVPKRKEFLLPPEWRAVAKAVRGRPNAAFVTIACLAGLRISEIINLRTDIDIDRTRKLIRVQPREGEYPWVPKGYPRHERSVRNVPYGSVPELEEAIEEHVRLGFAGARYFFRVPRYDRPISRQFAADRWVHEAFTLAGIRYGRKADALTCHSLRHTFISWLVMRDVSLKKIAILAGTSIRMIDETYGHLTDDNLDRSMGAISKILRAA